jgi:hypothetical protein
MAHIGLGLEETPFPGITGPMQDRLETAKPLNELAEVLLASYLSCSIGEDSARGTRPLCLPLPKQRGVSRFVSPRRQRVRNVMGTP